jgi:CRP/FNR family cyclic AMP-dependent transcriptional regulator
MSDIDMRIFAKSAGANVTFPAGSIVFNKGDAGTCMYVVQSGVVEMVIGDTVVEVCGPNEAIGFMSVIDGAARSSTARVKEPVELSIIDQRKFSFMVDEVPNFANYTRLCEGGKGGQTPRRRSPFKPQTPARGG